LLLRLLHGYRKDTPDSASSRIWAAICMGHFAATAAALFGQAGQPLTGFLAHRHFGMLHPIGIGRPAGTAALTGLEPGLHRFDDVGQPGGSEGTASAARHFAEDLGTSPAAILSTCFAICGHLRRRTGTTAGGQMAVGERTDGCPGDILGGQVLRREPELVSRHGPMVLRICRGVLHDAHDTEDAFQAVFLVVANRAGSIRTRGSVASWLIGVAQRVALRGKRSTGRRRALDQLVAERAADGYLPAEDDPYGEILHEEINDLPERLCAPIVLCYLQGLTYAAAADQLGLSEMAIRGRLARARERLRQRLTHRGVTVPAGLLVTSAPGQARAAIPFALIHSTMRIASGFMAGNTAAVLAREVLNSMLLDHLRVATVLLCLGIAGGYWAWRAVGSAFDEQGQTNPGRAVVRVPTPSQPPRTDRYGDPLPPGAVMRLGTDRFRQAPVFKHIIYSPDGRLAVTDSGQDRLVLRDARDGRSLRQIDLGIEDIQDFVFSPDGRMIATVGYQSRERGRNVAANHLTLIEAATGRQVLRASWDDRWNDDDLAEKVAYCADGQTVATVSLNGKLRLWAAGTAELRRDERLGEGRSRLAMAFSTGGVSRMLAIAWQHAIDLWDVGQVRRTRRFEIEREYSPDCLAFSPDGSILAAGVASSGAEIRLWDVGDGALLRRLKSRKNAHVSDLAFSPDGKVLAAIGWGSPLVSFDTASGKELDLLSGARLVEGPLAFSPDGKVFATTGDRQALHFWDLATGEDRLATPDAHQGDVAALAFLADGKTLVSGSRDRTARVWDLASGRSTRMFPHANWVDTITVSTDGSLLATVSVFPTWGEVYIWDLRTGERRHAWRVEREKEGSLIPIPRGLAFGRDGSSLTAAFGDGSLRRWDVSTGKERPIAQPKLEKLPRRGLGGLDDVDQAVFSPDGRLVALMGEGSVQVMDLVSGDRRFKEMSANWLLDLKAAFAPDGQSLAAVRQGPAKLDPGANRSGSSPPPITIVWLDGRTGHVRREIEVPERYVKSLAFSPDGQSLAVGTLSFRPARGIIRLFRLRDKQEIQTIESPCPWIEVLTFTPDGRRIVAGLSDTSIVFWDVRTTDERR
jgi:RNA polymerase sigma factor (sigma-70 family)